MWYILTLISQFSVDTVKVIEKKPFLDIYTLPVAVDYINLDSFNFNNEILYIMDARLYFPSFITEGMRGRNSSETGIYYEDIPLNSPLTGDINLSLLLNPLVNEMYIIKSGGFVKTGGFGAYINMYSSKEENHLTLSSGSHGRRAMTVNISPISHTSAGLYYEKYEGNYTYRDKFHREYVYDNTWFEKNFIYFKISDYFITPLFIFTTLNSGSPGPIGFRTESASISDTFIIIKTGVKDFFLSWTQWKEYYSDSIHSINGLYITERYNAHYNFKFKGLLLDISPEYSKATSNIHGFHSIITLPLSFSGQFSMKGYYITSSISTGLRNGAPIPLSAGTGFYKNGYYFSLFTDYRYPTLNELYWKEDVFAKGNPKLKPERATGLELGMRRVNFNLSIYYTYGMSSIIWVEQENVWSPQNLKNVHFYGIETMFKRDTKYIDIETSFKLSRSIWEGKNLPHVPIYKGTTSIEFFNLLSINLLLFGPRFTDYTGLNSIGPDILLSSSLHLAIKFKNLITRLEIKTLNILNHTMEYIKGYPLPGREFIFEIKIKQRRKE